MFDIKVRAPDFEGIKAWINTKPLTMEKLKGKVVLVDFWTYTCINCIRSLPHLKEWHKRYAKKGLVIVGVHSPEFEFEKKPENVKKAVRKFGIRYPVAVDSDKRTWDAFDNEYWPAKFLIDRKGYVVDVHFGEGRYAETERMIQEQLGIARKPGKDVYLGYMPDQSPETYAGFARSYGLGSGLVCDKRGCTRYVDPGEYVRDTIYPDGEWIQEKEYLELKKAPGRIAYRFYAREVNIVMAPVKKPVKADIYVNGKKTKSIKVDGPKMYNVFKSKSYTEKELGVRFHGKVRVYAYTFG